MRSFRTDHCWDDLIGPEERLIADLYEGTPELGQRPALLMVDPFRRALGSRRGTLHEVIEDNPSSCGTAGWDALPFMVELLTAARDAGIPVIHTTVDVGATGAVTRRRVHAAGADGTPDTAFIEELVPVAGEPILTKSRASAFFGTPLSTWLRQLDRDAIILAGQSTSGCVRATAVDGFSHGLGVIVAEEACFDRSQLSHRMSLFDLGLKYATVAHVDEVVGHLRSDSVSGRR